MSKTYVILQRIQILVPKRQMEILEDEKMKKKLPEIIRKIKHVY